MDKKSALLMFSLADRDFALDVKCVREVIRMVALTPLPPTHAVPPEILGAIVVRGSPLLVIDLRRRLGLPATPPTATSPLLLVEPGEPPGLRFAALVDQVKGIAHVNVAPGGLFNVADRLISQLDPQQIATEAMLSLLEKLAPVNA